MFRTQALRAQPCLFTADPSGWQVLSWPQVFAVLTEPLPATSALTVPVYPRRKHVVPGAQWGRVRFADACLPWGVADATRLATVRRLRRAGVRLGEFPAEAPPYRLIATVGYAPLLAAWDELAPWRERPLWLDLALTVTTETTKANR